MNWLRRFLLNTIKNTVDSADATIRTTRRTSEVLIPTLMPLNTVKEWFPAPSVHVPVTDCPSPLPSVTGSVTFATPDRGSVQMNVTVTEPTVPPKTSGSGLREPVIVGGVKSTFMFPAVSETRLPARSMQKPVTDWSLPSVAVVDCPE